MLKTRYQLAGICFGLFAMLMIHIGPLISAAQLYQQSIPSFEQLLANIEQSKHDQHNAHAAMQHHAMQGHHQPLAGVPDWVNQLAMCGYCELLTVSPPLTVAQINFLPFIPTHPIIEWAAPMPYVAPALWSQAYPRAPPSYS